MMSLPIGFIGMMLAIVFSVEADAWAMYINKHAIIIVVLGTLAILFFATPTTTLKHLWAAVKDLFRSEQNLGDFAGELKQLTQRKRLNQASKNSLVNYAVELWEQGIDQELFIVLLSQRRSELEDGEADAIQSLRNLSKYPPALGMTGTVIGLIALFNNLGSSAESIGPALALAMTATFFGLILTNGLIQPLADRLHVRFLKNKRLYTNLYHLLLLINQEEAEALILDEVEKRAAA